MSAIIPFDFGAAPVARTRPRNSNLNADLITHSSGFPILSIKGKVFTIIDGDTKTPLTREVDGDVMPVGALRLAVARANTKYRVFYATAYSDGEGDAAKPTCFSADGVRPDATVEHKQSNNCQLCPHSQWGSKKSSDGQGANGTACAPYTRLAVVNPAAQDVRPMLLRVPPASRGEFSRAVQTVDRHGKDFNEVVFKVSFDQSAATPKLMFEPVGVLPDDAFQRVSALYDDITVQSIVSIPAVAPAEVVSQPQLAAPPAHALPPAPAPAAWDEVDLAPAPAPVAAPKPAPAPRPAKPKPVAAPAEVVSAAPAPTAAPSAAEAAGLAEQVKGLLDGWD